MSPSTEARPKPATAREHVFDPGFRRSPFVVAALLELGDRLDRQGAGRLAADEEADLLVRSNPFAFLIAVLLSQGVPAARAFTAPHVLQRRLGHLSPGSLVRAPAGLRSAMGSHPMPHRFPDRATKWVLAAARRIVTELQGETELLWADEPTAFELIARLQRFEGIGQKKAAMAVEILVRDLGVNIRELSGSDVAVDVHIRRVFLRTGLVKRDNVDDIVGAARLAHPDRPGALDIPAWIVGRAWCRPQRPSCHACPISWACPAATSVSLDFAAGSIRT